MDETASNPPPAEPGAALKIAVGVLFAEALGLLGLSAWLVVLALTQTEISDGAGLAEAGIALGVAALLAFAARSLRRGRGGLRGAAIFVQLLILPLGYYLAQAGLLSYAVAAWILGAGTAVLLLLPSTRASLGVD